LIVWSKTGRFTRFC